MDISQNQITQEKEVFLKKVVNFLTVTVLVFLLISNKTFAKNSKSELEKVTSYIYKTNEFSSKFIQKEESSISEGSLYVKNKRIRVDYKKPTKIRIILAKNKAMYYNIDLDEIEYFNPTNSIAGVFYDIFFNISFLDDAENSEKDNIIILKKNIFFENQKYILKIFFENNPLVIKKITIKNDGKEFIFNIINPNFNPLFEKKFFSLINPKFKK